MLESMSDKPKKRGRPLVCQGQRGKAITIRLALEARTAIEELARQERRTVTQMAKILLEDAIAARKKPSLADA